MDKDLNPKKISVTPELVSETEMLQIYGGAGDDDVHVHMVEACNVTYTYCHGAYCANCSETCGTPPDTDDKGEQKEKP